MTELFTNGASAAEIGAAVARMTLDDMLNASERMTLDYFGSVVTYSRKVFIPLTRLCRDVCHYCTFATTPQNAGHAYLSRAQVLEIARAGKAAGCREALFTLGDQPEARYEAARRALEELGHTTTLGYLREMAALVLEETGLLPHLNPGLMNAEDYAALRPVAASMGLMLESSSARMCEKFGPHYGSPDKAPALRLATIEAAGQARVAFTTGLLIGIGETRAERIEALVALRDLQHRYGHIQEVIIQNFRAKPGTRMADHAEPDLEEHQWSIAAARLILGSSMSIQAPPNLQPHALGALLRAGVNDWGGVSPVTQDHVNPEAPWPHLVELEAATADAGRLLRERLAIGPAHARAPEVWLAPPMARTVRRAVDSRGLPFVDDWRAGTGDTVPPVGKISRTAISSELDAIVSRARGGGRLNEAQIARLFEADGPDFARMLDQADALRDEVCGDTVTFVVTATSTTPTSACTNADSAHSQRAAHEKCAGRPTGWTWKKSAAAPLRR
jgi:FO synthase